MPVRHRHFDLLTRLRKVAIHVRWLAIQIRLCAFDGRVKDKVTECGGSTCLAKLQQMNLQSACRRHFLIDCFNVFQHRAKASHSQWIAVDVSLQFSLLLHSSRHNLCSSKPLQLTSGTFFHVGQRLAARRVFDSHGAIGGSGFFHFMNLPLVKFNSQRQSHVLFVVQKTGRLVASCPARISQQKYCVVLIDSFRSHLNKSLRFVWYVVFGICRR